MKLRLLNKTGSGQFLLVILIWLLIFILPLLSGESDNDINWQHVFKIWKEYGLVFLVFLLNRFLLLPHLFFKQRRFWYFTSIVATVGIITFSVYYSGTQNIPDIRGHKPPPHSRHEESGDRPPPHRLGEDRSPPHKRPRRRPRQQPPYANVIILSLLIVGFDTGLVFSSKWAKAEQNKLKAEKESIANKMAFLQNQVSPHFFMNTLNNIHALVDIDAEEAKDAIIKLSRMMDYMLYESQSTHISLKQELEFISSYIELMKLRFTDDIDLVYKVPEMIPQFNIPPLLTISFIENAFKYGISNDNPSFIHIYINVLDNNYMFRIKNKVHGNIKKTISSGIGIENARKRLDIIYGKNYKLSIDNNDNEFEVNLSIPL